MTLTNSEIVDSNEPGEIYLGVLEEGLKENYPKLRDEAIRHYLGSLREETEE